MLCEQPTPEDYEDGLLKHQLVMEFDMDTWRVRPPSLGFSHLSATRIIDMCNTACDRGIRNQGGHDSPATKIRNAYRAEVVRLKTPPFYGFHSAGWCSGRPPEGLTRCWCICDCTVA